MKSMIISAVFGTAILAIHGMTGAVMPLNTVKRDGAFEVRSEALEEAHSPAIERAVSASTTPNAPDIPSAKIPAGFSTTTCVHTTAGLIQCDDILTTREKPAAPSMDSLEKRGKKLPLRDGYPDRAGKCDKLHNLYHWAQTSNHPPYCHQLMDKNPPDQLWDCCYVLVPCNVPNGARPYQTPLIHSPGRRSILEKRTYSEEATTDRGCNGKGTAFYFTNDTSKILCNGELVKGSETYRRLYPGAVWNLTRMSRCFVTADCPGGAHFGS